MSEKCDAELNLMEICRLCLAEEGNKTSIFDEMGCDTPLTVKISFCVSVEVAAGDGLPELICQNCTSHVNSWYLFKKQCQTSDAHLRDCISKRLSKLHYGVENGSTESVVEGKVPTRRKTSKCLKSVPKRRVTSASKQMHSPREKDKTRARGEKGWSSSPYDAVLEECVNEEVAQHFQAAEVNMSTKDELRLGAAAPSRVYTCSMWQRSFTGQMNLRDHEVPHSGDKFTCKDCDKAFFSARKLKQHLKTHSLERPFLCSVCGKSFREKSDLKRHFCLHSEESCFLCNVCGKTFKTMLYLNRHLATHSGEKKFTCSECGKAFRWRDSLLVHEKVHTLERPLPCNVCGKGFKRKEDLIRHTRVHTGEKPFVCVHCERSFSDKWNLTQHVRLHTGQKPYVCAICDQAFTHNVTLRKHAKLKHFTDN